MKVVIFDDMAQCTDDEVARMLPLVSEQRREQALKFKFTFGKFACLKSYLMLKEVVNTTPIFEYNEFGKPLIVGHPEIHFSISHCKHGIAVAVSDQPVGIDIECFHSADEGLLMKTMNEEERQIIASSANPSEAFTSYWTSKETVLKLRGTGITDDLYPTLNGTEHIETHINTERQYVWSVAYIPEDGASPVSTKQKHYQDKL